MKIIVFNNILLLLFLLFYTNLGSCKKECGPPCSRTEKRWKKCKACIEDNNLGYSFVMFIFNERYKWVKISPQKQGPKS